MMIFKKIAVAALSHCLTLNSVVHITEETWCWAGLVAVYCTMLVFNKLLRPTQPGHPSQVGAVSTGNNHSLLNSKYCIVAYQ